MLTKNSVATLFVDSMLKHKLNFILSALLGAFGMQFFGFVIWLPMLFFFGSNGDGQEGFFSALIGILITTLYNLAIFFIPLIKNIQHFMGKLKEQGIPITFKVRSKILGFLIVGYLIINVVLAIVLIPFSYSKTFSDSFYNIYYFHGPIVTPIVFLVAFWKAKNWLNPKMNHSES
jgi:hypothetical protein